MEPRIYLDNNASTPLDPRVIEKIRDSLPILIGNPSSTHFFGQKARNLVNQSRSVIAAFLRVKPQELIFTSGGTEGINMAILGMLSSMPPCHIITSAAEHSAVIAAVKHLETKGCSVSYLPPGLHGAVTPEAVLEAIRPDTKLITLMAVNNETGVKTDIAAIGAIANKHGIPFVVDAISLLGKELFDVPLGVSAMVFGGHKLHALQGVGLNNIRSGVKLQPLIMGGEQEFGRRAGTENVLGIISLAKAVELLSIELPEASIRMQVMRDKFESMLLESLPDLVINGEGPRTVNVSNIAFPGIDGEALLMALDRAGVAASHGSACSSGGLEPSRVLLSMGIPLELVRGSVRFSLSRMTTDEEIERACEIILDSVKRMR